MKKLPELLAPAGTLDAFKTAILYGADAIYAGLPNFSMRARAKIDVDGVRAGIDLAHSAGRQVFLAFNLFAHDYDMANMDAVRRAIEYLSPDALIIADAGVMAWVRENFPDLPIHISTQANICSAASVKFWAAAGATRCVLAREVSLREFESIRAACPDVGLEIFVHGAMCMAYSGRCLLSNFMLNRNANRGACAQMCRWGYDVILRDKNTGIDMQITEDARGAYIMNSRDLCLMPRLADVLKARPDSLKIEGRNRSEYYVGSVVRAYRNAIDDYAKNPDAFDPAPYMADLEKLESRGFTLGFLDGAPDASAHNYESARSVSEFHAAGVITAVRDDAIVFELRNALHVGDTVHFILPYGDTVSIELPQLINAKNGENVSALAAGQSNAIIIPRTWFGQNWSDKFAPFVLAYKHK